MGLTAATLLREADYAVNLYAEKFTCTTSDVAGGQWAPSFIRYNQGDPSSTARFIGILKTAHRMHRDRLGSRYGVSIASIIARGPATG